MKIKIKSYSIRSPDSRTLEKITSLFKIKK